MRVVLGVLNALFAHWDCWFTVQRMLHAELNTLNESCTFKGKCAVNAENLICDEQTSPLTNMIFEGRRTMLKAS